ncbi:Crp/Fnr family transcriptional regulator [Sphaerisporangium sp. NPDC051011]|uniref:Crp/Fnr family transcriptional regulator n=1 Tax=Sphaerisporangium sp. NPDC051011 TaxID=3155792 RepID=UPI0033FB2B1A
MAGRYTAPAVDTHGPIPLAEDRSTATVGDLAQPKARKLPVRADRWPSGTLLASLNEVSRQRLLTEGVLRQFTTGETLIWEGDHATGVYVLLEGCVKVTADTEDGQIVLLGIRVGGDLVGEISSLDGQPRSSTVTAAGPTLVRRLSQSTFIELLSEDPGLSLAVHRAVAGKLRAMTRRRIEVTNYPVRTRLARVLVELASSYGQQVSEGIMIGVALTQPELAALVGAREASAHKELSQLRREGIIGTGYRRIVVRDMPTLLSITGLGPSGQDEVIA